MSWGEEESLLTKNQKKKLCRNGQRVKMCMMQRGGGVSSSEEIDEEIQSLDSFETVESQGYRTDEDDPQEFSVSMVSLGWMSEELKNG